MALSISGAMMANFFFLGIILYRKLNGYSLAYIFSGLGKVVIASSAMGAYLLFCMHVISPDWMHKKLLNELLGIFFFILSGGAVYGFILYMLRLHELKVLVDTFLKKTAGQGQKS